MFDIIVCICVKLEGRPFTCPKPQPRILQSSHSSVKQRIEEHLEDKMQAGSDTFQTNGNNGIIDNNVDDQVDEGIAVLSRQPSIKDRKKVAGVNYLIPLFQEVPPPPAAFKKCFR